MKKLINPLLWANDVRCAKKAFARKFEKTPNILKPRYFNEKILHRKIFDRRSIYKTVCDRLACKQYVAGLAGRNITPRTEKIFLNGSETVNWRTEEKVAIKTSQGWGDTVILNIGQSLHDIGYCLGDSQNASHGRSLREWGYYGIKGTVFAEEYIRPVYEDLGAPADYKFFVFGGKTRMINITLGRGTARHRKIILDENLQRCDFEYHHKSADETPETPPSCLQEMSAIAELIGRQWDFIRVDMYWSPRGPLVGELTPYPAGGLGRFSPGYWDQYFGECWELRIPLHTKLRSVFRDTWAPTFKRAVRAPAIEP